MLRFWVKNLTKLTKWIVTIFAIAVLLAGIMLTLVIFVPKHHQPFQPIKKKSQRSDGWMVIDPSSFDEYFKQVPQSYIKEHMKELGIKGKDFPRWHIGINSPTDSMYKAPWVFAHFFSLCASPEDVIVAENGSKLFLDIIREFSWYSDISSKYIYINCQYKYIGSSVYRNGNYSNLLFFESKNGTVRFLFLGTNWRLAQFVIMDLRDFNADFKANVLRRPVAVKEKS